MELSSVSRQPLQPQSHFFMTAISRKLGVNLAQLRALYATSPSSSLSLQTHVPEIPIKRSVLIGSKVSDAQLKENWLASLSCPFPLANGDFNGAIGEINAGSECVLGIDPDTSGALALLKTDEHGCSAQVYDSPHLQVLVGKRIRKRLDAKEIVQLLQRFEAPIGTKAYIEQSSPFPQDGKQGWWTGGFGYGLWIGILVALGYTVIPVPSLTWKNNFCVSGKSSTKDDSRRVASILFPSLNPMLKRKKDHGRAEALLIAAYGKGLKIDPMLINSLAPRN